MFLVPSDEALAKVRQAKQEDLKKPTKSYKSLHQIGVRLEQWYDISFIATEIQPHHEHTSMNSFPRGRCTCGKVSFMRVPELVDRHGNPKTTCRCTTTIFGIIAEFTGRIEIAEAYRKSVREIGRNATNEIWKPLLSQVPNFPAEESVVEGSCGIDFPRAVMEAKHLLTEYNDTTFFASFSGRFRCYRRDYSEEVQRDLAKKRLRFWWSEVTERPRHDFLSEFSKHPTTPSKAKKK